MRGQGFSVIPNWIIHDSSLSAYAKLTYVVLTGFTDGEGYCFPSHKTLAANMRVSVSTAKRALQELRDCGLVEWVGRADNKGGQTSNFYRLVVQTLPSHLNLEPPVHSELPPSSHRVAPQVAQSYELKPINNTQLTNKPPIVPQRGKSKTQFDEAFNVFWEAYPRKTSKQTARKAFEKALKLASVDEIVAGAKRYAADPNRVDEYTKHPATWLNGGCWEDDALPTRSQGKVSVGNQAINQFLANVTGNERNLNNGLLLNSGSDVNEVESAWYDS